MRQPTNHQRTLLSLTSSTMSTPLITLRSAAKADLMWPGYHVMDLFTDIIVTCLLGSVASKGFTSPAADPSLAGRQSAVAVVRCCNGAHIECDGSQVNASKSMCKHVWLCRFSKNPLITVSHLPDMRFKSSGFHFQTSVQPEQVVGTVLPWTRHVTPSNPTMGRVTAAPHHTHMPFHPQGATPPQTSTPPHATLTPCQPTP